LQASGILIAGLATGSVIAIGALAVIGRAVARKAADNPEGASDIMLWVLGIIAFVAVMFIIIAPRAVWRIVQRGRELTALPLSGLSEQAQTHALSFRATPENAAVDLDSALERRLAGGFLPRVRCRRADLRRRKEQARYHRLRTSLSARAKPRFWNRNPTFEISQFLFIFFVQP
jgi:hypothetical protein